MGGRHSRRRSGPSGQERWPTRAELQSMEEESIFFELSCASKFERHQIRCLYVEFKRMADKADAISRQQFLKLFFTSRGLEMEPSLVHSVFKVFDRDQNGEMDFIEFVAALSLCWFGSAEDRAACLFRICDVEGKKKADRLALRSLLQASPHHPHHRTNGGSDASGAHESKASNSSLSLKEFSATVTEHEVAAVLRFLFNFFPSRAEECAQIMELMDQPLQKGDTWFVVSMAWWKMWGRWVGWQEEVVQLVDSAKEKERLANEPRLTPMLERGQSSGIAQPIPTTPTCGTPSLGLPLPSPSPVPSSRPPSLDNSKLDSEENAGALREDARENVDFVVIPTLAYQRLCGWYGGGPHFPRHVIECGSSKECVVELFPLVLHFVKCGKNGQPEQETQCQLLMSRTTPLYKARETAGKALGVEEDARTRLWVKGHVNRWERLGTEKKHEGTTLENLEVQTGDIVLMEIWNRNWPVRLRQLREEKKEMEVGDFVDAKDSSDKWYRSQILVVQAERVRVHFEGWPARFDEWVPSGAMCTCTNKCTCGARIARLDAQSVYTKRRRDSTGVRGFSRSKNKKGSGPTRGVVGLANLGNTCFMNATLQALSNTPLAGAYFIEGRFERDVNRKNKLGHRGRLAREFAALLQEMWSGNYSVVAPRAFRKALVRFAPRFGGYEQHDAHELLSFLLDGLNEDLNRVKHKPLTPTVEGQGRPDHEVAAEAWEIFRLRNRSVIVDLFMGQLKSTIRCPHAACGKVSVTFDPFIALQLPVAPTVFRRFHVVLLRPACCRWYAVDVDKAETVSSLLGTLGQLAAVQADTLCLGDVSHSCVYRLLGPGHALSQIHSQACLVAWELVTPAAPTEKEKPTERLLVQVVHKCVKTWSDGVRASSRAFGLPFVLQIEPQMSGASVHQRVRQLLSAFVDAEDCTVAGIERLEASERTFRLLIRTDERGKSSCGLCSARPGCCECVIADSPEPCGLGVEHTVVVLWDGDANEKLLTVVHARTKPEKFQRDATMESPERAVRRVDTLEAALNLFTSVEQLSKANAWYCPQCKEFRQATKELQVWRTPEILVVQLKRFRQRGHRREKISNLVEFPLKEFDLSKFVVAGPEEADSEAARQAETRASPIFDLFAVVNHMGSTSGGHYTAFCQNPSSKNWYLFDDSSFRQVNASRVVSPNAYILYYRRR